LIAETYELVGPPRQLGTGVTFVTGEGAERVDWGEFKVDAARVATELQQLGVGQGSRVAVFASTSRASVTLIAAIWACRAALVMLPLPTRVSALDTLRAQTWRRISLAGAAFVVADGELLPLLQPSPRDGVAALSLEEIIEHSRRLAPCDADSHDPSDIVIVQFTSGSTDDPKMVPLRHSNVVSNVQAIAERTALTPGTDIGLSWLPLFHDMGLIGFLATPMMLEVELVLIAPELFLRTPGDWMRWISDRGATIIGGPNFAYGLAARTLSTGEYDLSSVRLAFNGAESIDVATVERFLAAATRRGFDADAMYCVYGLAEATLAATLPLPGSGMTVETLDSSVLEDQGRAVTITGPSDGDRVRRLARLGRPVRGVDLRVMTSPDRETSDQGQEVGEICLRGSSVVDGYLEHADVTESTFKDGWLSTGDLGYLVDGDLVVTGRAKDLIIIGGRNIAPEEVETVVARVSNVRRGNVIAFSVPGRHSEELVIVAESRQASSGVRNQVREAVQGSVGVAPRNVVLIEPGALPKTSSGKLQRSRCRQSYLDGTL
jgi:fatty-acyl-CoA synthase